MDWFYTPHLAMHVCVVGGGRVAWVLCVIRAEKWCSFVAIVAFRLNRYSRLLNGHTPHSNSALLLAPTERYTFSAVKSNETERIVFGSQCHTYFMLRLVQQDIGNFQSLLNQAKGKPGLRATRKKLKKTMQSLVRERERNNTGQCRFAQQAV